MVKNWWFLHISKPQIIHKSNLDWLYVVCVIGNWREQSLTHLILISQWLLPPNSNDTDYSWCYFIKMAQTWRNHCWVWSEAILSCSQTFIFLKNDSLKHKLHTWSMDHLCDIITSLTKPFDRVPLGIILFFFRWFGCSPPTIYAWSTHLIK